MAVPIPSQAPTPTPSPWEMYQQALAKYGPPPVNPNAGVGAYSMQAPAPSPIAGVLPKLAMAKLLGGSATTGAQSGGEIATGLTPAGYSGLDATPLTLGADSAPATGLSSGFATFGIPAAVVAATYLGEKSILNSLKGKVDNSPTGIAGRVTADIATGGFAELAHPGLFGGKSQAQQSRDSARGALINSKISDPNFMVNGFDLGRDGGAMLQNSGTNIDNNSQRHIYDVDFSNPLAKDNVAKLSPLVSQLLGAGASQKQQSDTVGMLMNALTNGAKTQSDFDTNFTNAFKNYSGPGAAPVVSAPRSQTRSPGIRKDGSRISYSRSK